MDLVSAIEAWRAVTTMTTVASFYLRVGIVVNRRSDQRLCNISRLEENQEDGKLLVLEQYERTPSSSLYHPGKIQTTFCTNFMKGNITKEQMGDPYMTTTEAQLTGSPYVRLRELLRTLLRKKTPEIHRVFVGRIGSDCQASEQQAMVEWVVRSQKDGVQGAIIVVMDAPDRASLLRFIMTCFNSIHKSRPGLPIVVMVRECLLEAYYGGVPGGTKNEIASRILAENKVGVRNVKAFNIISFKSGPDGAHLHDAYSWLYNRIMTVRSQLHVSSPNSQ